MTTSVVPFNRLVRLAARAFYDDLPAETAAAGAGTGQHHAQGTAVVVLDALTRRDGQWVREDDLAASLRLQPKPLRRVLRYLEEDKIVSRDHRKEPAPAPAKPAAAAEEGEEKERVKLHVKSYCCLDYAQACDAVRYRMHRMRKRIRDELTADSRATVQHYLCPACGRRYSALDALRLIAEDCQSFRCEHCSGELVVEKAATIAADDGGGGEDGGGRARKRRRLEKLQDMQRRMEEQLGPLQAQIQRVEGLPAPEFMSLRAWQKENNVAAAAAAAAPCRGDPEVELGVLLLGADQSGTGGGEEPKVFPPWMVKLGMDHTGGKAKSEGKLEEGEDDKKMISNVEEEEEEKQRVVLEQEYAKAYYEALLKQQQLGAGIKHEEEQQLGAEVKHEDGEDVEEEDGGIEWEDGDAGIEWEDGEN